MRYKSLLLIAAAVLFTSCLCLCSCSRGAKNGDAPSKIGDLSLTITEDSGRVPIFSFSSAPGQPLPRISRLEVSQVDDKGLLQDRSWYIRRPANNTAERNVTQFVYGEPPQGWGQNHRATPLQDNIFYSINGVKYFCRNTEAGYSIYSQQDFDKLRPQSNSHGK